MCPFAYVGKWFFFQNFVENKTLTVYITSVPLVTMKRKTSNDDRFLKELMRGQIQVSYIIDNYGILYDFNKMQSGGKLLHESRIRITLQLFWVFSARKDVY